MWYFYEISKKKVLDRTNAQVSGFRVLVLTILTLLEFFRGPESCLKPVGNIYFLVQIIKVGFYCMRA